MKSVVKIIRLLIPCILISSVIILIKYTPIIDKDMTSLIQEDSLPIREISSKNAYTLNIIFKTKSDNSSSILDSSSSTDQLIQASKSFYSKLDRSKFVDIKYRIEDSEQNKLIELLSEHKSSLISDKDFIRLSSQDFDYFVNDSIKQLTSSFSPSIIPFEQDPFFIFSNYLKSIIPSHGHWTLDQNHIVANYDGNSYLLMSLSLKKDSLDYIGNIFKLKDELQIKNQSISVYLSGVPVHSYFSMKNTKKEITYLTVISFVCTTVLSLILLHSLLLLILILVNILLSFMVAYCGLILCFDTVHILTFVFATSLIGLSIDYSFHFLSSSQNTKDKVIKNMLKAFFTTVCCFIPLLFSDISLLEQIGVFVIVGLSFNFLTVTCLYPIFTKYKNTGLSELKPVIKTKFKYKIAHLIPIILPILLLLPALFYFNIKTDIKSLYLPDKYILESDTLFKNLSSSEDSNLLLTSGSSIEELLENEEKLKTKVSFFSLSSIVPSTKKQHLVSELLKKLYDKKLPSLKSSLSISKKIDPPSESPSSLLPKDLNSLTDPYIIETSSRIYSITPISSKLDIHLTADDNSTIVDIASYINNTLSSYTKKVCKVLLFSFTLLFLFLSLLYKKQCLRYILPSLSSILTILSIISISHIDLNLFHLLSLFIIIGVSIDYTIFTLSGHFNQATLFSFLSTFIGFSLLYFTDFKIISSMGLVLGLGLLFSFLYSYLWRSHE